MSEETAKALIEALNKFSKVLEDFPEDLYGHVCDAVDYAASRGINRI